MVVEVVRVRVSCWGCPNRDARGDNGGSPANPADDDEPYDGYFSVLECAKCIATRILTVRICSGPLGPIARGVPIRKLAVTEEGVWCLVSKRPFRSTPYSLPVRHRTR